MVRAKPAPLCALLCTLWSTAALAQSIIRQGGEFQVNRYTFNHESFPAVGVDADGDFIVSWNDVNQEAGLGIIAARFNSAGAILGGEFHVNSHTPNVQSDSAIAVESNGDFVIVWQSYGQAGYVNGYSVFGQRFDSGGARLGIEFQVNIYTSSVYAFRPRIGSDADGDFIVVWQMRSLSDDGSDGIFGRRFNSSGAALATEFVVNDYTPLGQHYPSIAVESDGDFVVTWDSFDSRDGEGSGVFAQRFASSGARLAIEFQVNTYTTNNQDQPWIAADANGGFVVAWQSTHQDGAFPYGNLGIFARRFSSAGSALATEFQVNVYTTGYQRSPRLAMDDDGDFVVIWESQGQDGSYEGVFARRFRPNGIPVGGEFQVNAYTSSGQLRPNLDWDSDGDFVIAWYSEPGQDGDAYGVFAQRFSLPPLAKLDVDGNGAIGPLTDGLLLLRFLSDFTDTALTNGAIGPNCSRCDATSVISYLNGLDNTLDIDDNGGFDPLTDGVLVIRFLFGFTGTTLTDGAVATGTCMTRCDAATILTYLQTLD